MNLKQTIKLLITMLSAILIVLAIVGIVLHFTAPELLEEFIPEPAATTTPQTPVAPQQNNPEPPVVTAPVVTTGPGTPQQQYAEIFDSVGASMVVYATTTSGEIYNLYAAELAAAQKVASSSVPLALMVATLDLNADKVKEAIVYNNLSGFCGSGGCAIDVWQKNGSGWQKIFEGLGYETIGVTQSTTGGYKNLLISVHGDIGYMTKIMQYVFKDGGYQAWNLLAVWNGTTFAIPQ